MRSIPTLPSCDTLVACAHCGMPPDARPFDQSRLEKPPDPGRLTVLASFRLPPEYCGILEYFAQFTDEQAKDPSAIQTKGLTWSLRLNQQPFAPYVGLDHIANPWGIGGFPIRLKLEEGSSVDLVVRGESPKQPKIGLVGGRLVGRYWYNRAFGDVARTGMGRS